MGLAQLIQKEDRIVSYILNPEIKEYSSNSINNHEEQEEDEEQEQEYIEVVSIDLTLTINVFSYEIGQIFQNHLAILFGVVSKYVIDPKQFDPLLVQHKEECNAYNTLVKQCQQLQLEIVNNQVTGLHQNIIKFKTLGRISDYVVIKSLHVKQLQQQLSKYNIQYTNIKNNKNAIIIESSDSNDVLRLLNSIRDNYSPLKSECLEICNQYSPSQYIMPFVENNTIQSLKLCVFCYTQYLLDITNQHQNDALQPQFIKFSNAKQEYSLGKLFLSLCQNQEFQTVFAKWSKQVVKCFKAKNQQSDCPECKSPSTKNSDLIYKYKCTKSCGQLYCIKCKSWHAYEKHDVNVESLKKCPNCYIPIDKIDGCNHIHCACGYHFCYLCCDVAYKTQGETYGHMQKVHGNFV
ncbi:Ankyrin_repeat protein 3 [Hexamita inflata]|uniref:Ankyrin repeat protein 3 n=1 Tax=Hexamita inflata TaxID=28002 RepID=A0AA86PI09_9EUKA|nr:Ankyrin repeat protein 3 [Hexamita inflata]CAI9938933.1 Ankyrin repeat protein 3 [Hexamita inflata]